MADPEHGTPDSRVGVRRARTVAVRLVGLLLSLIAVLVLVNSVDLAETARYLGSADARLLVAAGAVVFGQLAVVTLRWSFLLPSAARGRVGWAALLRPVSLGYLGNFLLPARLGELIRAAYINRRWRIPMAPTIGSVILERVLDTAVLGVVAFGLAILLGAPGWVIQVAAVAAAAGLAIVGVLAGGVGIPLARWLEGRVGRAQAVGRVLGSFLAGAGPSRRGAVVPAALLSAVSWTMEGIVYWMAATAVGLDIPVGVALLVAAITVLATAIPAAPAYVGTFELAVTVGAGAFGVPPAAALAWGVVAHAITVLPLMLAGVVALGTTGARFGELVEEARSAQEDADGLASPGATSWTDGT